ncbi:hypothetical protein O0I10_009791 [Lichtheimia ornata]|uniref:PB1 domain-containing protein n=1 Tax=Lichtheimia ornata TaxID=688661 RepID=A0AAD7XU31_9FUNG|nr:uncharacterized protein O0I10_009791 [Lichtheimia ornata]KAJ8654485.1 hypothetical protein O0I10_009791 [Lichtheimia ornata]
MNQYELQEWINACRCYDNRDYDKALRIFMTIGDNAKMHFNIGVIFSIMQDHHRALAAFKKALKMDPFLAVACFQKGVSHFALGEMDQACQAFDLAQKKLRGNPIINYHQLGLAFRLYECEVLFNRGICHLNMGKIDAGLTDLYFAQKAKMTEEHSVVDQAIRDRGDGYSVYSIPPGVLFRPPEYKVQQLRGGGYTGTAACGGAKRNNNSILVPPVHQHHWTQHLPMIDTTHRKPTTTKSRATTEDVATTHKARRPKRPPAAPPLFENERGMLQEQQQQQQPLSPPLSPPPPSKTTTKPTEMQGWKFVDQRQQQSNPQPAVTRQPSLSNTQNTGWLRPEVEKKLLHDNTTSHHLQSPLSIPKVHHNNHPYHVNVAMDTMSSYGDALDEELEKVYANLDAYLKNDLVSDAEQSTSSSSSSSRSTSDSSTQSTQQQDTITNTRKPVVQHNQHNELPCSMKKEKSNTSTPSKLKIKAHYHDTRVLVVPGDIQFDNLLARIRVKFDSAQPLRLQYKDEENELVLMIDQDDLAMARHIAQLRSNHKTSQSSSGLEKLELWCLA